jgi:hypothetical protein
MDASIFEGTMYETLSLFGRAIKSIMTTSGIVIPLFFGTMLVITYLDYIKSTRVSQLQKNLDLSFAKNVQLLEQQMNIVTEQNKKSMEDRKLIREYQLLHEKQIEVIRQQNQNLAKDTLSLHKAQEEIRKRQEELLRVLNKSEKQ